MRSISGRRSTRSSGCSPARPRPRVSRSTIECAPELPRSILGDGAKVKQILINLASNALKFTERGSIRFKASASDASRTVRSSVKIVVADTGIGIAAQDAARIFQPFEQLDAGKRAGGTGLGLAISLGHARLMGGDLTVESAPGVGSTFTFTFAAKSVGLAACAAAGRGQSPRRGRRDESQGAHRRRRGRQPGRPRGAARRGPDSRRARRRTERTPSRSTRTGARTSCSSTCACPEWAGSRPSDA